LPAALATGLDGGDLFIDVGEHPGPIALLRRPTPSARFESGHAAHWRLVSHLALNLVSLAEEGLAALKEALVLYDLRRSAV
ncbi:type VI secretion system baseplate subunit TssF, partial [Burkholderia pseudomallei]